jgi:hypothetical protein
VKKYTITVNGTAYEVEVEEMGGVAAPKAAAPKAAPAAAPAAAPKALLPLLKLLHRLRLQNLLLLAQLLSVLLCLVKFSKLKLKLATQLKLATY